MEHSRPAHQAGHASASPAATALRLSGPDVLTVLHRISTQALLDLTPGRARWTLFCDFRGRLLHRACVAVVPGAVWLLRADAPAAELAAYVDRHVFREQVAIAEDAHGVAEVPGGFGREAGTLAESAQGLDVQIDPGFGLRLGAPSAGALEDEASRIAAGRPRHGREVAEDFTPFEVGRAHEVHLAKGCFTGQEALLRTMTYASVRRRLVRLDGEGGVPDAPLPLLDGTGRAAVLTSVARAERGWIGLAVMRRDLAEDAASRALAPVGEVRIVPFAASAPAGLP